MAPDDGPGQRVPPRSKVVIAGVVPLHQRVVIAHLNEVAGSLDWLNRHEYLEAPEERPSFLRTPLKVSGGLLTFALSYEDASASLGKVRSVLRA